MSSNLRIIIITGNSKRHHFFVREMEKRFIVLMAITEQKFDYKKAFEKSDSCEMVNYHFSLRDESEMSFFGNAFPKTELYQLAKGKVNEPETVKMLRHMNADFVLLYGSSIIKKPLLEHYEGRVINLHLGLSPYYRGSGTNFWPIVDALPECIGATIHLAVPKVDAGPVLHQIRPTSIQTTDGIHDLGNKTILAAVQALPEVLVAYSKNQIIPLEQKGLNEIEFKRMDLSNDSIRKAYSNIKEGLISDYLSNYLNRNNLYPIIEFNPKNYKN